MIGFCHIRIHNKRNVYDFTLHRNITILCGDSGRGKTTLYDMVNEYGRLGKASGVSLSCDRPVITVSDEGWEEKINKTDNSVIVIDEDSAFLRSQDFARSVQGSTNYFLLITRNYLSQLPYSVDEIYQLQGSKNKRFVPVYVASEHVYDHPSRTFLPFHPDVIITEDSHAGFQFFAKVAAAHGMTCVSADGKSNIYPLLRRYADQNVVVIADGAAFGADMRNVVQEQEIRPANIAIFLPESFEWLILVSGVAGHTTDEYVMHPEQFLDSSQYMSWERYFTDLLVRETTNSPYMKYTKEKLPAYYLQDKVQRQVCDSMTGIQF